MSHPRGKSAGGEPCAPRLLGLPGEALCSNDSGPTVGTAAGRGA